MTTVLRTISGKYVVFRKREKVLILLSPIHFVDKLNVMDDETFFTITNSETKGNGGFYTNYIY